MKIFGYSLQVQGMLVYIFKLGHMKSRLLDAQGQDQRFWILEIMFVHILNSLK